MPVPQEVDGWICRDPQDDEACVACWQSCDQCDGNADDDERCPICQGSGGGYVCATHDIPPSNDGGNSRE